MALATAALTLAELLVICLGFASLGNILLRFLRLEMDRGAEQLLCAVGAGLVASEVLLFLVQITQQIRSDCLVIVVLLCVVLILEWKRVSKRLRRVLEEMGPQSSLGRILLAFVLGGIGGQQSVLVFMQHAYYLDVPYVNGDPSLSFEVDPTKLQSPRDWKLFFEKKNIGYVVRSPSYPSEIAGPLEEMEKTEDLAIIAHADVQSFHGNRIDQTRTGMEVVILKIVR